MLELKILLQEMDKLEMELRHFETKFGVKSADFYQAITKGELEDFDALDEYRPEFIEWLAFYKMWLSLEAKYRQLITRQSVAIQIKTTLTA
jgi:hypothetical protein